MDLSVQFGFNPNDLNKNITISSKIVKFTHYTQFRYRFVKYFAKINALLAGFGVCCLKIKKLNILRSYSLDLSSNYF